MDGQWNVIGKQTAGRTFSHVTWNVRYKTQDVQNSEGQSSGKQDPQNVIMTDQLNVISVSYKYVRLVPQFYETNAELKTLEKELKRKLFRTL
jgi:hypothetical protein